MLRFANSFISLLLLLLVTAMNGAECTVLSTILVGSNPSSLVIAPDGRTAYVLDNDGMSLTPIDLKTYQKFSPMAFPDQVLSITISKCGTMIYALTLGKIIPVNLVTLTVLPPVAEVLDYGQLIGTAPDQQNLYVVTNNIWDPHAPWTFNGYVTAYPVENFQEGPMIYVGEIPNGLAFTSSKPFAYVVNSGDNNVTPIDLKASVAHPPIKVGTYPVAMGITPDDAWGYVVNKGSRCVTPIKLSTRTTFPEIPVGNSPVSISIAPVEKIAYVANFDDKTITPINTKTRQALSPISLAQKPFFVAVTPDNKILCVVYSESNEVALISIP